MGCERLLIEPWTLRSEAMAQEFLQPRSNEWKGTIQRLSEWWTLDLWAGVYSFRKEGRTLAGRTNKYIDGKFSSSINPNDGHTISDCIDPRERRILEFVVPIVGIRFVVNTPLRCSKAIKHLKSDSSIVPGIP